MDVLDAISSIDDRLPDGLLMDLAHTDGVDASSIVIRSRPRKGRHGLHAATWTQDDRNNAVEGHTLDVALRRALRTARAVSAKAET